MSPLIESLNCSETRMENRSAAFGTGQCRSEGLLYSESKLCKAIFRAKLIKQFERLKGFGKNGPLIG